MVQDTTGVQPNEVQEVKEESKDSTNWQAQDQMSWHSLQDTSLEILVEMSFPLLKMKFFLKSIEKGQKHRGLLSTHTDNHMQPEFKSKWGRLEMVFVSRKISYVQRGFPPRWANQHQLMQSQQDYRVSSCRRLRSKFKIIKQEIPYRSK